jgi:hypothetical protein
VGSPAARGDAIAAAFIRRCAVQDGLIEMGRGRAIRVTGNPERGAVIAKTKELIDFARHHGYHRDELIALMYRLP